MSSQIKYYAINEQTAQTIKRTLNSGPRGLSFDDELEKLFEDYHRERYGGLNRFYPLLGALVLVFFLLADRLVIPSLLTEAMWIRVGGAIMIILMVGASHWRIFQPYLQLMICLATLAIHIGLLAIGAMAAEIGQYHYQTGTIITVIFLCTVLRVQFNYAFPFCLMCWLTQIFAMHFMMDLPPSHFVELLFVFTFVTAIGLLVNYRVEYETRKTFLQQLLLVHEQDDLMRTRNELKRLSLIDVLTKLANRRSFNDFLDKEWRRAQRYQHPISLLMIDVDNFKAYNDHYGHQAGDDCLVTVADCLAFAARRPSDLVARYGGEEFSIVLPQTDEASALSLAETAREQVDALAILHEHASASGRVTISIGLACMIPDSSDTPDCLIKQADLALYEAKRSGKNRVSIYPQNSLSSQGLAQ